jgi:hypothetical protein
VVFVALAEAAVLVVVVAVFASLLRSLIRQQARERGLLLDQMMHLAGRTWNDPPAAAAPTVSLTGFDDDFGYADPAQLPGY